MLRNYYTIYHLATEFRKLCGCVVIECFSQEKDSAVIDFYGEGTRAFLLFSCDTRLGSIYLSYDYNKASTNSVNLLAEMNGKKLLDVHIWERDRVIEFRFDEYFLFAQLYGGANSNLILTNDKLVILNSFKHKRKLNGSIYKADTVHFKNLMEFPGVCSISEALSKCSLNLGKYYSEEFCYRMNLEPGRKISLFEPKEIENINNQALEFSQKLKNAETFYILKNKAGERLLSLIHSDSFPETDAEFVSISQAIRKIRINRLKEYSILPRQKLIRERLIREYKRISKRLEKSGDSTAKDDRITMYGIWGGLLLSNPQPDGKAGDVIVLEDWNGFKHKIPLKAGLTLKENASLYFDKSKNLRLDSINSSKLKPVLEERLKKMEEVLVELEQIQGIKELEKFERKNRILTGGEKPDKSPLNLAAKFKVFDLGEGYTLYVGKNAANNDELTQKFAKPDDIWLHARGGSGSHAVLRGGSKQKPPKCILEKAASIAAYYSSARKAKYAPVCHTLKKYVRKPKGSETGSVIVSREEVILVKPMLPEQETD